VNVLKYLMNLAVNDQSYFQVKAIVNKAISLLSSDYIYRKKEELPYASEYSRLIREFHEHPEKFKLKKSPKIPDGSPIGSDVCNYNSN
jgi:hypothetical protein